MVLVCGPRPQAPDEVAIADAGTHRRFETEGKEKGAQGEEDSNLMPVYLQDICPTSATRARDRRTQLKRWPWGVNPV